MSQYSSYSVPVTVQESDAPLTQEQREQLRSPGRAVLDGQGFRVEGVASGNTMPAPTADKSEWWNFATLVGKRADVFTPGLDESKVLIPVMGDMMTMSAARAAGFLRRDGSGKWLPIGGGSPASTSPLEGKPQDDKSKDDAPKPQEAPAEDRVGEQPGDSSLGQLAERFGDSAIYSLIEQAALGQPLTEAQATKLAQIHGDGAEPGRIHEVYGAFVEQYGSVATAALVAAGVSEEKVGDAMQWLAENRKGQVVEAFYDMIGQNKRNTTALKALGREFVKATGAMYSDDELQTMSLPEGAEWIREGSGPLRIRIKGWGESTAQSALRQGVLKP